MGKSGRVRWPRDPGPSCGSVDRGAGAAAAEANGAVRRVRLVRLGLGLMVRREGGSLSTTASIDIIIAFAATQKKVQLKLPVYSPMFLILPSTFSII